MNNSKLEISRHVDLRGELIAVDNLDSIPFKIERLFLIQKYDLHEVRGNHAHIKCQQFLIILNGSVDIVLDNGRNEICHSMNSSKNTLYVPPLHWLIQKNASKNLQLLVLASDKYDVYDYITSHKEFIRIANE
jgi:hypothetical protein